MPAASIMSLWVIFKCFHPNWFTCSLLFASRCVFCISSKQTRAPLDVWAAAAHSGESCTMWPPCSNTKPHWWGTRPSDCFSSLLPYSSLIFRRYLLPLTFLMLTVPTTDSFRTFGKTQSELLLLTYRSWGSVPKRADWVVLTVCPSWAASSERF